MSDHRCPQIVISFKLLSGKVQVKDIFTLSYQTVDGYNYNVFGKLRTFKKKERHPHTKMHDGSSDVSIMFDASLMLIS